MHSFKAKRLLLISAPSYLVYLVDFLTSAPLSEPARSIKLILPCFFPFLAFRSVIYKIACDLEELAFMPVYPTTLSPSP